MKIALALILLATATAVRLWAAGADLLPVAQRNGAVKVLFPPDNPLIARTGEWCRDFLGKRNFRAETGSTLAAADASSALWLLETEQDCRMSQTLGVVTKELAAGRADAFLLYVGLINARPVVAIVGKDSVGLRSGVARLIGLLVEEENRLLAPAGSVLWTPFFAIRELVVANRGTVLKNTPYADTLWRRWSDERIRTYAEQLWLLGFNSVQISEARSFRITPETEQQARDVALKLAVLSDAAHGNGLRVSQLIWGQAPFNRKICWSAPDTRAVMEEEFRWMARTYATKVDHVVMHMRDPGGCNCGKCDDYRTPQEIAAFVLKEYWKCNPAVTLTLSTWFNQTFWACAPGVRFLSDTNIQFWTGDPAARFRDPATVKLLPGAPKTRFLDESFSPQEIGIALHKWYNPEKARLILSSGRAADIWGWYLSDQETTTDMSLCMRRLDYYFSSLPPQAANDISRISTELCFHGWPQILNAYVSGQKMWSPHRDLREIEREYCVAMFGEKNAEPMVELYEACELVANPKRGDTCLPALDAVFGNPTYNQLFRTALETGRKVVLDAKRPPKFTSATPPQELLDYLLRHLALISALSDAQEVVNAAIKTGADRSKLEAMVRQAEVQVAPFTNELMYPALIEAFEASLRPRTK